jgi:hypothetical protein
MTEMLITEFGTLQGLCRCHDQYQYFSLLVQLRRVGRKGAAGGDSCLEMSEQAAEIMVACPDPLRNTLKSQTDCLAGAKLAENQASLSHIKAGVDSHGERAARLGCKVRRVTGHP